MRSVCLTCYVLSQTEQVFASSPPTSMAMPQPPSEPELASYGRCSCHIIYGQHPLPPHLAPADEEGFDWNKCYWGSYPEDPHERKPIRGPLPTSITNRIPLEVYKAVIDILKGNLPALNSCALVCHAWFHCVQDPFYRVLEVHSRSHFDYHVRRTSPFQRFTRILVINFDKGLQPTVLMAVPKVLAQQLRCLIFHSFHSPQGLSGQSYHTTFMMYRRFSSLSHLHLRHFTLRSFEELRRVICAFPALLHLGLEDGKAISNDVPPCSDTCGYAPITHPRIRRVDADLEVGNSTMASLARWMTLSDVFSACTDLTVRCYDDPEEWEAWLGTALQHLGSTLITLDCIIRGSMIGDTGSVFLHVLSQSLILLSN